MEIKVLGPGCPRCKRVEEMVREAVAELGVEATLSKVKDIGEILQYDILSTPGLVIDEKVVSSGRIPSKAEIISFIVTALDRASK